MHTLTTKRGRSRKQGWKAVFPALKREYDSYCVEPEGWIGSRAARSSGQLSWYWWSWAVAIAQWKEGCLLLKPPLILIHTITVLMPPASMDTKISRQTPALLRPLAPFLRRERELVGSANQKIGAHAHSTPHLLQSYHIMSWHLNCAVSRYLSDQVTHVALLICFSVFSYPRRWLRRWHNVCLGSEQEVSQSCADDIYAFNPCVHTRDPTQDTLSQLEHKDTSQQRQSSLRISSALF